MKRTSTWGIKLNIAPVQLVINKEILTDEQDIWTIKMETYDYEKTNYDAMTEIIFDRENGECFTTKSKFIQKQNGFDSFKRVIEKEKEYLIAVKIAIKYIKALYEIEDEE